MLQVPKARYEDLDGPQVRFEVVSKFQHTLFTQDLTHSPFDVVTYMHTYIHTYIHA